MAKTKESLPGGVPQPSGLLHPGAWPPPPHPPWVGTHKKIYNIEVFILYKRVEIPQAELERQREICFEIRERIEASGRRPLALVDTYGCQQNEADSEEIRGYIELMGYGFTDSESEADLIVVNTCAIREHAEMRVLGNVGALVHAKAKNPNLQIGRAHV